MNKRINIICCLVFMCVQNIILSMEKQQVKGIEEKLKDINDEISKNKSFCSLFLGKFSQKNPKSEIQFLGNVVRRVDSYHNNGIGACPENKGKIDIFNTINGVQFEKFSKGFNELFAVNNNKQPESIIVTLADADGTKIVFDKKENFLGKIKK
jgi:hypothetical protein